MTGDSNKYAALDEAVDIDEALDALVSDAPPEPTAPVERISSLEIGPALAGAPVQSVGVDRPSSVEGALASAAMPAIDRTVVEHLSRNERKAPVRMPSIGLPSSVDLKPVEQTPVEHHLVNPRGATTPGWDASSAQSPRVAAALQTPSSGTTTSAISCPTCRGPVDVKSRHVAVHQGAVRVYCSGACLEQRDALPVEAQTVAIATLPPKRRRVWWLAALVVPVGIGAFFILRGDDDSLVPPPPAISATQLAAEPATSLSDPQREADAALVAELARDAWIHPLAGPTRRMPRNHNGAFGAERPGERPPECVSGHCGVDLGYVWGEPIHAVHGGVIDFVQRGSNDDRGGQFVRISHRNGTLFSWYFHLAAVPRTIKPGVKVNAGDVIGLLGDTGIKRSDPHLHFALSVKTSKHVHERYLDPEPLIAIWPLWIPNETRTGGALATNEEPGIPQRATGNGRKRRKARADKAETSSAAAEVAPAAETAPATGTSN
jgi:murein DD-endopeptidase MepM/ murein hydrolase activator NlpD